MAAPVAPPHDEEYDYSYLEGMITDIIVEGMEKLTLAVSGNTLIYEEVKIHLKIRQDIQFSNHLLHITSVTTQYGTPSQILLYSSECSRVCVDIYASGYSDAAVLIAEKIGAGSIEQKKISYTKELIA